MSQKQKNVDTRSLAEWHADKPHDELPRLPPKCELETKPVLKECIEARAALGQLKQAVELIPNSSRKVQNVRADSSSAFQTRPKSRGSDGCRSIYRKALKLGPVFGYHEVEE